MRGIVVGEIDQKYLRVLNFLNLENSSQVFVTSCHGSLRSVWITILEGVVHFYLQLFILKIE